MKHFAVLDIPQGGIRQLMVSTSVVASTMIIEIMMTSSNGNIFHVTGSLWVHRSPVNSPHKGQWRGALMFSLICAWTCSLANNQDAGNWRRRRAHWDVTVMIQYGKIVPNTQTKLQYIWHSRMSGRNTLSNFEWSESLSSCSAWPFGHKWFRFWLVAFLAHPLHHTDNRSRNRHRNLWVGWCVSSWWPLFPPRSSVLIYIYTCIYIYMLFYMSYLFFGLPIVSCSLMMIV